MVVTIVSTFNINMSNYFDEFNDLKLATPIGCMYTFPVFIFSFTTQINLLQCFEELEVPTLRRMHKVLAKQHFICFSIYLFIGLFGYLSFPLDDGFANSYLERYQPVNHLPVLVAVLLLILVIYVAQPFNSLPCKESFEYFLFGSGKAQSPTWLHLTISIGMHAAVTFCACLCIINHINMDKILGYFSAASSTFVAYIFPFGFFLNTFTEASSRKGRSFRRFIQILYWGFWVFQILSIVTLFLDPSEG